ncbi:hypothetical protein WMY93_034063, partial [Mugilogobius chulae]
MSPGSTVIVEPTSSKAMPRSVLVGRLVTPLWGDRWVPMTIVNPTDKPITLKRNCKLADVSPCLAIEDFDVFQGMHVATKDNQSDSEDKSHVPQTPSNVSDIAKCLSDLGLGDLDIDSCQVSDACKLRLAQLLIEYQDIFSRHSLDCGEVQGYTHRIRLTDDRPFRLPYRRVPPAHYQKLRQVLSDMEEKGIIRKST